MLRLCRLLLFRKYHLVGLDSGKYHPVGLDSGKYHHVGLDWVCLVVWYICPYRRLFGVSGVCVWPRMNE